MNKKLIFISALLIVILIFGAILFKEKFYSPLTNHYSPIQEGKMRLTTVFANNEYIPSKYTCDGEDAAPELTIEEVPQNAKSLALIVDDPDAPMGTWVHWILFNIPVDTTKIDYYNLPEGSKMGMNDFGKVGWGGPCPPNGVHRYFFKLYAVDKTIDLLPGAKKSQVEKEIKDHVIEKAELIGLYKRK